MRHPLQLIEKNKTTGNLKFRPNAIVQFLAEQSRYSLDEILAMGFLDADRFQYLQLLGKEVDHLRGISFVDETLVAKAINVYEKKRK
jgi:hypothetical protein